MPETATNYEIGVSQQGHGFRWEALAYRMEVEDEIDFDPATFTYDNIGRSLHRGVEASARVALGPVVSPFVSYAWTRVEAANRRAHRQAVEEHPRAARLAPAFPSTFPPASPPRRSGPGWPIGSSTTTTSTRSGTRRSSTCGWRRPSETSRSRLDLGNLTNTAYSQYGYALFSFLTNQQVPYYYPGSGFTARIGVDWKK